MGCVISNAVELPPRVIPNWLIPSVSILYCTQHFSPPSKNVQGSSMTTISSSSGFNPASYQPSSTQESSLQEIKPLVDDTDVDTAPTGQVPGGGLEAHENAGSHLIERHVGKSEQWLINRVNTDNVSAASSFKDLPSAEHFIAETIAQNQDKIDAWVDGKGGKRLVLDASFDSATGISVKKGENSAQDVFDVKLVLERSDALGIGYRIVTGYPT